MVEISEAAKAKAFELARQASIGKGASPSDGHYYEDMRQAFARFIQQVSDAVKAVDPITSSIDEFTRTLDPFILPEPVDPMENIADALGAAFPISLADRLRQPASRMDLNAFVRELAKRGLKIVEATDA